MSAGHTFPIKPF